MQANYAWIDDFVRCFPGGDVVILEDALDDAPTTYRWSSPHLNGLTKPASIGLRAASLKALFDGALYVDRRGNYAPWALGNPVETLHLSAGDTELRSPFEPFCADWAKWTFKSTECPYRHPVSLFLFLAHYSAISKDMLIFLGANGPTWVSLYAMKDFMTNGGWTEAQMAAAAGVSAKEIERFRRTANNHAALGPFARHGATPHTPPRIPMKHADAVKLVLGCVDGFLRSEVARLRLDGLFASKVV